MDILGKGEKMNKEDYREYINRVLDEMNEKDICKIYWFLVGWTGGEIR